MPGLLHVHLPYEEAVSTCTSRGTPCSGRHSVARALVSPEVSIGIETSFTPSSEEQKVRLTFGQKKLCVALHFTIRLCVTYKYYLLIFICHLILKPFYLLVQGLTQKQNSVHKTKIQYKENPVQKQNPIQANPVQNRNQYNTNYCPDTESL